MCIASALVGATPGIGEECAFRIFYIHTQCRSRPNCSYDRHRKEMEGGSSPSLRSSEPCFSMITRIGSTCNLSHLYNI